MKFTKQIPAAACCLGILLLLGCGGNGDDPTDNGGGEVVEDSATTEHRVESAKKIFYMLPSPIETASLLKKAGASYNGDLLNPIENVSSYETTMSKAINLGIYGSDLSYTSIFDQTNESMLYVTVAKKLSDGLGVTEAFDKETMDRVETNINDKDSMLNIISECYWIADSHLKEGERHNISALIITGGWIEGLHIACQTAVNNESADLKKRICEQKYSLDNLISLVGTYGQDADVAEVLTDLKVLKAVFDQLEETKIEGSAVTQDDQGITVIGGNKDITVSDDILIQITDKAATIRNKYING